MSRGVSGRISADGAVAVPFDHVRRGDAVDRVLVGRPVVVGEEVLIGRGQVVGADDDLGHLPARHDVAEAELGLGAAEHDPRLGEAVDGRLECTVIVIGEVIRRARRRVELLGKQRGDPSAGERLVPGMRAVAFGSRTR